MLFLLSTNVTIMIFISFLSLILLPVNSVKSYLDLTENKIPGIKVFIDYNKVKLLSNLDLSHIKDVVLVNETEVLSNDVSLSKLVLNKVDSPLIVKPKNPNTESQTITFEAINSTLHLTADLTVKVAFKKSNIVAKVEVIFNFIDVDLNMMKTIMEISSIKTDKIINIKTDSTFLNLINKLLSKKVSDVIDTKIKEEQDDLNKQIRSLYDYNLTVIDSNTPIFLNKQVDLIKINSNFIEISLDASIFSNATKNILPIGKHVLMNFDKFYNQSLQIYINDYFINSLLNIIYYNNTIFFQIKNDSQNPLPFSIDTNGLSNLIPELKSLTIKHGGIPLNCSLTFESSPKLDFIKRQPVFSTSEVRYSLLFQISIKISIDEYEEKFIFKGDFPMKISLKLSNEGLIDIIYMGTDVSITIIEKMFDIDKRRFEENMKDLVELIYINEMDKLKGINIKSFVYKEIKPILDKLPFKLEFGWFFNDFENGFNKFGLDFVRK